MSTVPAYPDATSPTPASGLLWLIEGSGASRDKKVPAGTLVADLLGQAITGQPAPTTLTGSETFPIVQAGTGKEVSILAAADAVAVNAPSAATLTPTNRIMTGTDAALKGVDASLVFSQAVDLAKNTTNKISAVNIVAETGPSQDFDTSTTSRTFIVERVPLPLCNDVEFRIRVRAVFVAFAGSSSNLYFAQLQVPEAAFPLGWFDEIAARLTAMGGSVYPVVGYKTNSPLRGASSQPMYIPAGTTPNRNLMLSICDAWSVLFPTDNTAGAIVYADIVIPGFSIGAML